MAVAFFLTWGKKCNTMKKEKERRDFMKKTAKTLTLTLAVLLSVSFLCVGYATITGKLSFSGSVTAAPDHFEGVYIVAVEHVTGSNASYSSYEYIHPTNLKTNISASRTNASITFRVTVENNTDISYWYLGLDSLDEYGSNALLGQSNGITVTTTDHQNDTVATFDTMDWIPPKTQRTFYVTLRYGANATGSAIDTMIRFCFGLHMDSVQDEFLKVLNDKSSAYGYHYLKNAFDAAYAEEGRTEIGNIGADVALFNNLFGSQLSIDIDGTPTPVTVIVSRKNMDSNTNSGDAYKGNGAPSGCEYTVYITTDSLSGGSATVYAVSYTCDQYSNWYQIGELYEGICTTNNYDSENKGFNVSSWDATPNEYKATDDISYSVGLEQGDQYDKLDSMEELLTTKDQDFYNAVNNNSEKLLKPACQILYTYEHRNGQWVESINNANNGKPGYDSLMAAFAKIKPYCYIGNGAQEVKIQNANSLTRAELVQLLKAIQHEYDYYLSVN